MKRLDLINILKKDADLLGVKSPTARDVRFWVDQKFIKPASRKGRGKGLGASWNYSEESQKEARKVLALKRRGINRSTEIRFHLYLGGACFSDETLKIDMCTEIERSIKKLWRGKTEPKDYQTTPPKIDNPLLKQIKRLGPQDDRFAEFGFNFSSYELVLLASQAYWSHEKTEINTEFTKRILSQFFSADGLFDEFNIPSLDGFLAMRDDSDSTPWFLTVQNAETTDLVVARELFILFKQTLKNSTPVLKGLGFQNMDKYEQAFCAGADALKQTEFCTIVFPLFIQFAQTFHNGPSEFNDIIKFIRDLCSHH